MSFTRVLSPLWVAVATGGGALEGCETTAPSTSYTPITGIELPSADIVAGHGCGTGSPDQVYKYAAIVGYAGDAGDGGTELDLTAGIVTSGVFDCFADGIFSNLPLSDAGNSTYIIGIYAYNQCSFPPELACVQNASAACPTGDASVAQSVASQPANWTATCNATQIAGVTATAYCPRLEAQDGAASCADAAAE